MKALTRAEEQIMQILWDIEKGFVKDIIEEIGPQKPAYNTISTICRILEKKGFLDHKSYGNSHQYFPLVSRETYTTQFLNNFMKDYFNNSFENLVSFFSRKHKIKMKEADRIIHMMNEIKKEQENE